MSDYGFVHDGRVYTPNGTPGIDPADNDARNAEIERTELAYWHTRPERMIAYYHEPSAAAQIDAARAALGRIPWTVQTWLGTALGVVTAYRVYRHNFGHRFVSIRVKGTNGTEYYGRASYDGGSIIRLRRVKS